MLDTSPAVIRCLVTYADWWQTPSGSILKAAGRRRKILSTESFAPGLIATLDLRNELRRRMARLSEADRKILFLWYVEQLPVAEICRRVRLSRRQCFRRRAKAIQNVIDLGKEIQAA